MADVVFKACLCCLYVMYRLIPAATRPLELTVAWDSIRSATAGEYTPLHRADQAGPDARLINGIKKSIFKIKHPV